MKTASVVAAALAATLLLPLSTPFAAEPAATTTTAEPAKDEPKTRRAKPVDHRCTASRIRKDKAEDCEKVATPTRTYTQEEIQQTGEIDVSQALRKLDPRFN